MNSLKEYIKGTGWAKFIEVMNIVNGVLIVPIGILAIIFGINLGRNGEIANILGGVVSIVGGILVILTGMLTIIAGIKLWRGAKNLENYTNTKKEEDLEEALKNLLSYFKWMGWISIVGFAILVIVIGAILVLMIGWIGMSSMSGLD